MRKTLRVSLLVMLLACSVHATDIIQNGVVSTPPPPPPAITSDIQNGVTGNIPNGVTGQIPYGEISQPILIDVLLALLSLI